MAILKNPMKHMSFILKSVILLLFGFAFTVPDVGGSRLSTDGPFEFLPFGHFDDIELEEGGFPAGNHRRIGLKEGDVYVDDRKARSGTHSLYIEGVGGHQANGFGVVLAMTRPLPAGETYRFSVWFRAPELLAAGDGPKVYARIQGSTNIRPWNVDDWFEPLAPGSQYTVNVVGENGHLLYIRAHPDARQEPNDSTDWHPLTVTFTLPEGVGESTLIVNVYNESEYPLWIDDLSLQRL